MSSAQKQEALLKCLLEEAQQRLASPPAFVEFTGSRQADVLVNDLERYPHAYVVACIMDRQMPAKKAWAVPHLLRERLGYFDFPSLAKTDLRAFSGAMNDPTPIHRFPKLMAENVYAAIQRIAQVYGGDAARIWLGQPSSAAIVRRFLEFKGVGQKIGTMAANILVRDFRVPVSDRYSIDISVDAHVSRVFSRLGFAPVDADPVYIVFRARELSPSYPGIFDVILWELGREVCRPKNPLCHNCRMSDLCPHPAGRPG